jgi:hypothetical protein
MSAARSSYRWLEKLLLILFERYDSAQIRALLQDSGQRAETIAGLRAELVAAGADVGLLDSASGENLFLAVAALRVKFPRDEALAKVRQNIAMRER